MKTLKFLNPLIYLIILSLVISCSNNPNDPTDPCTNKKIIAFSIDNDPSIVQSITDNLTFGEFNSNNGFITLDNMPNISLNKISPNDSSVYNPDLNTYSFLFNMEGILIHYNRNSNTYTELQLEPREFYALTYSSNTQKYYALRATEHQTTLYEADINGNNVLSKILFTGNDALEAYEYNGSNFKMITDEQGYLYILTNKEIISLDLTDFNNNSFNFHSLNNQYTNTTKYSSLMYDDNKLKFLKYNRNNSSLELRSVNLPLSGGINSSIALNLNSQFSNFNQDYHSATLTCDGGVLISNHIDLSLTNQSLQTVLIKAENQSNINSYQIPNHIFGLESID